MPTIPTSQGPTVREQPLQATYQKTPDVSSYLQAGARGLMSLGAAVDEADRRAAIAKADQVEANLTSDWLKWDAANRGKFRGENVGGYEAASATWWKEAKETYGKDLDPRARALVSPTLTRREGTAMANVGQFVAQESDRHADEMSQASVATAIQFAVTTGDPAGGAEQVRSATARLGARKGWNTDQVQAEQQKQLGAMHLAFIAKLSATDPAKAQEYYQANKGEVPLANQARVEEVLRAEGDNQFARQFGAQQAGKPLSEQLAAAGVITDPQRREKALIEVKNNHAMVQAAKQESEAGFSDRAWQLFAQNKSIPEAILAGMDGKERAQLREAQRTRADRLSKGEPIKTNPKVYIDLRERLARGEKIDLRGFTEKVSQGDLERLLDIQNGAKDGGVKQDSMLTDEGRLNAGLTALGIDKKKDEDAAIAFIGTIDRQVRAASAAKGGKDLTADEKQKIIDGVVMDKVYVDEWGRDPEKALTTLTNDQMTNAYVKVDGREVKLRDVPSDDRRKIIVALKATNQLVTEQNIARMWLLGQKTKGTK